MKPFILLIAFFFSLSLLSAQHRINGRILSSEDNSAIQGASVSLQGTDVTVKTNEKGEFLFQTRANTVGLLINHIGYDPSILTVSLPQTDTLNILLRASIQRLEEVEVVSTGYQRIPKERATGSFSTVSNELFNQQIGTDILSRLPAVTNGMVMDNGSRGGSPQMMIRGLSTIRGPKDPLIVVDNFPYDGDITNINPNIVETITVLKDASASSIWGARAANGVIVITTKGGSFNQAISISFNSNVTIGSKPDLGYLRIMSTSDFIDVEQELFSRNFYNSQINSTNRPVLSPVVDLLNKVRSGELNQEEAQQQIDKWRVLDARDQFNKYVYKPSVNQQYFLSAQGGTDKISWTSSVGYDHNKNNLGARYKRTNFRFQNNYRPIKQLSLTTGVLYTQNQNNSGRYGYNEVSMKDGVFVPYMVMADVNGDALPVSKDWNRNYIETAGEGKLLDWNYYPLTDWQHQTSQRNISDILATAILDYQIIQGLSATINYQYEKQVGLNSSLADENSYMARDYINRFTQIVDGNPIYTVPRGGILDKSNNVLHANNFRGQVNFDRRFGRHNVTAIFGSEVRSLNQNGHGERFYGYNPYNLTTGAVDYTRTYLTLPRGSTFIARNQSLNETSTRFVSQYGNAAYTFDDRYVLSASARRDASNLFGLKTNDQWNPFWSVGLAWKVSNEKFYTLDALPYINVRATYGFSGNIDPSMVAANTITYFPNNSLLNGEMMARISNYYNPDLKWETSKMLNLAIDFRTKNNRISGSVEYYHKKGENLFGVAPIDYTTGVESSVLRNVASMKGNGWDIELKSLNIDRTIKWQTILNFSLYNDRVAEYLIERTLASEYVTQNAVPISGINGKPIYSIYAYKWAGLDPTTGEAQGYLDGEISKDYRALTGVDTRVDDLEYFGSALPTKFGSLINAVSYKSFNLQIGISFKLGHWLRRKSINYTNLFNGWTGHSDYTLRWQGTGDEEHTYVPVNSFTTNSQRDAFYNGSSVLVEKADHIRLQYINLSYDFVPTKITGAIKGFQVYFNTTNLGLLWKANKSDIDPDFNMGAYNVVTPTNYAIGIRTKF